MLLPALSASIVVFGGKNLFGLVGRVAARRQSVSIFVEVGDMAFHTSDLKKYNFFFSLSDRSLEFLSQKFIIKSLPKGAEVTREGDPADHFYFIKQGRLEVTRNTKYGLARLSVITSGQGFGEIAILTGSMRSASIRALTEATLYQLAKPDFETIMREEPAFKNALLKRARDLSFYDKIKTLQPFVLLDPDKMYALQARMVKKTYSLGDDIIVQGEKGDYYYIIKSGRVAVLKKKKGEDSAKQAAILYEGDGFGEEALIRDDPRNATCRAIEETTVYAIDKVDFDKCLRSEFLDNIFAEDITVQTYREKYVVIDARVPPEYEQEHIEGAFSIPIEVLRDKYRELDPRKAYITYCTNDSRGMVAAFLLKNHGFNARCLRGGISSWEGPVATGNGNVQAPVS
jgi:CRP-like cAMP-binding protein